MNKILVQDLLSWLDLQLKPALFQDYAPNGLQLQGKPEIKKVITGVTASARLLEIAAERDADAVLVHHGWFWKGENPCIVGSKFERVALAIRHGLNVIGYHLPLDAHPQWGNNAQLARVLGLVPDRVDDGSGLPSVFGRGGLIWSGQLPPQVQTLSDLGHTIEAVMGRKPLLIGNTDRPLRRIAWCTGGAQGMFEEAIDRGVDVYLTGEASEQVYHQAVESGVAYVGAGHHATERYGVQALGEAIAQQFGVNVEFVDIDNPV
ncbi:metal-binding protein [Advenella kashmirensis W13003]|uniref:Metal-binding protein n=1 Tax=Advenella kashmirensis W13003 TaxID=1424334 RepID=V8QTY5_9BURK|nr:Nif3-like dinuclear metal center hexameric protein [Advenella kashmirensis]ETF03077.1 metal-binding protein [Advenella kashmirensis W13003]